VSPTLRSDSDHFVRRSYPRGGVFCAQMLGRMQSMMNHRTLRELAKFGAGFVAADFLSAVWIATHGGFPVDFLGFTFTEDVLWPTLIFDASLFLALVHYGWHIGTIPRMRERTYLLVAGSVFGIVAVAHLARVFAGADIILAGWAVPLWLSWIGTAFAAYLSYASLRLALSIR